MYNQIVHIAMQYIMFKLYCFHILHALYQRTLAHATFAFTNEHWIWPNDLRLDLHFLSSNWCQINLNFRTYWSLVAKAKSKRPAIPNVSNHSHVHTSRYSRWRHNFIHLPKNNESICHCYCCCCHHSAKKTQCRTTAYIYRSTSLWFANQPIFFCFLA